MWLVSTKNGNYVINYEIIGIFMENLKKNIEFGKVYCHFMCNTVDVV